MSLLRKKSIDAMVGQSASRTDLKKVLGATDLVMLGLGAMVGTGIFVISGIGATRAGPALTLAFLLAAAACALAALCYAEFASMIPVAGSSYTYAYGTIGEVVAWVIGWSLIAEYGLATAAVSAGWSGYFQSLLAGFGVHLPTALTAAPGAGEGATLFNLPAFVIMMMITALLSLGIRESKRINNLMVLIKVAVVLLFIVVGFLRVEPANWQPYAPFGLQGVISAGALMFFAFLGFDAVSSAAEEARDPQRTLPIGLMGSLGICALLYVAVAAVCTGVVPYMDFEGVDNPISMVMARADIEWLRGFIDLAAVLGMMTVILVMAYGLTRIVFAISRDGLLPQWLSRVSKKTQVPVASTWALGTLGALLAGLIPLTTLAELINMGTLVAFTVIAIAIPVLRKTRPDLPRAFVCPGSPILPIASVLISLLLMFNLALETWVAFGIWLLLGLVVYFGYSRRHSRLND